MKQRAGRQQVTLVQHALRQRIGVHPGIDPAKQPRRRRGKGATGGQRQLDAAGAGQVQPGANALGMAAQLALVNAPGQGFFQQGGRGQRGQQLGVQQALIERGRRGHETHTPARRQNFGKTADINRALQAIQRAQAGGVLRGQVAVGVVFHHMEIVLVGQLQHPVRAARRQAKTRGVVEHTHAHKQLRVVQRTVARHHRQVGPVSAARYRQDAHAQRVQPGKLNGPAGLLHHHVIPRAQQGAAHQIQRVRGPHGGDDLLRCGSYVQPDQLLRQRLAQPQVASGLPVLQRKALQRAGAGHAAHGGRHEGGLQPVGREHAHARLRLVTLAMEHAAYQRCGVDRHMLRLKTIFGARLGCLTDSQVNSYWSNRFGGWSPVSYIKALVAACLDQALGQQLVIGGHHRAGAHALLLGALAHRGQTAARRHQPTGHARGQARGQLARERLRGYLD